MCCKRCKATWSAAHWSSAAGKSALSRRMLWQGPLCCHGCNHLVDNMCKSIHLTQSVLEVTTHCPKLLTRALLLEAATEHAMRVVEADSQVRRWKPHPCSKWKLLYDCAEGQVGWNSLEGKARQPPSPPISLHVIKPPFCWCLASGEAQC